MQQAWPAEACFLGYGAESPGVAKLLPVGTRHAILRRVPKIGANAGSTHSTETRRQPGCGGG